MESLSSFSPSSFANSPLSNSDGNSSNTTDADGMKSDLMVLGSNREEGLIGVLEVYIHQARDIHNICIYHNQDVYAKFSLTSSPDSIVSSRTINGGGRNPIFNEKLQLNVQKVDASLKCEIWMMSVAKNVLEDQLLGFALVPISTVVSANGILSQEFSLSSTDLFHSPAGSVQLSLSYRGHASDLFVTGTSTTAPMSVITDVTFVDSETDTSISSDYTKVEFPDLTIANENERMVTEYFVINNNLDAESSESFVNVSTENHVDSDIGSQVVESLARNPELEHAKGHSSLPCSSNGTSSVEQVHPVNDAGPTMNVAGQTMNDAEQTIKLGEAETKSGDDGSSDTAFVLPVINITVPEQPDVQQHIVDLYMKSVQEFTESLSKMKLPMDIESSEDSPQSVNSSSGNKPEGMKSTGAKVFYGSRAFF